MKEEKKTGQTKPEEMNSLKEQQEAEQTQSQQSKPRNKSRRMGKGTGILLHILQHGCLIGAAIAITIVLLGSFVVIETRNGSKMYRLSAEESDIAFEDSELFNQLLGNNVSDIICYGAIRAQMETDGKFDPKKEVDATAFANRYEGIQPEYITADYYLEDMIKWAQYGFEYEDVFMSSEEVDEFLSRTRTVTTVDFSKGNYSGGTVSYLNSDLRSVTKVIDVSGNMIDSEDDVRDPANATILNNRYHTIEGKNIENYVSDWNEYYELCAHVKRAAEDLKINYDEYLKYNDYYQKENTNLVYYILRTIGSKTEVFSNQQFTSAKLSDLEKRLKEQCGRYIIYDPKNMVYETNTLIEEATLRYILNGYEYSYPEDTQILIGVKSNYAAGDAFTQARAGFINYSPYFWNYLGMAAFCSLMYLFLLVILTLREGQSRRKDTGELVIRLHQEDRIPTEIMLILAVILVLLAASAKEAVSSLWLQNMLYRTNMPAVAGVTALLVSLIFSFFYYSLVRRIKAKTLWKNSLLKRMCDKMKQWILYLYDHAAVVLRVWIPYGALMLFNLILLPLTGRAETNYSWQYIFTVLLILVIAADVVVGILLYRSAMSRQQILSGIKKINDGDMEHKIDETALHGDNLVLAQAVNSIGDGIRNAVATSMKDERLKADLITNVSHDIKTPLTSIINYVDLIKRENVDNPKVKEYIEVLDVKSQRLKQLTDDLVEASKISSGNIVLQWEKINLVELLNQTIGEFSEKFEQKLLTPVLRTKKNSIFIEADSRRIWRVIENLFNNIFKYALEGTRVYIDIEERESQKGKKQVALSVRNISANPIKVNADELTERFIRGDESRTTEGSGLGLSIAKNLTEAQKGKFEIAVDGDLFKVILTFPLLEQK